MIQPDTSVSYLLGDIWLCYSSKAALMALQLDMRV